MTESPQGVGPTSARTGDPRHIYLPVALPIELAGQKLDMGGYNVIKLVVMLEKGWFTVEKWSGCYCK